MAQMGIKQTLSKGMKGFGRLQASHGTVITFTALLLILFIAFTVRVLPIRWEIPSGTFGLNEFDPYYQYSLTNRMVSQGLLSPYWPTSWINYQQFYPSGLDMSISYPSLPATTAVLYNVVSGLGVNIDLMSFCSLMAPILGVISVLLVYFVGKDMGGKSVGLLSALILSLSPSVIQRSSLGFFDTETTGVISLLLFIFLFLRAIDQKKPLKSMFLYSIGSALALAYFASAWGANYFLVDLIALFAFVLIITKRYSQRLLISYSISFGLGFFIAITLPINTPSYLTTGTVLPVLAVFALLCLAEVLRTQITARTKTILAAAFLAFLVIGFAAVIALGDITSLAGKFVSVLDPFARSSQPLIESVAEHRITAWGSMYYELGIGILFFLMGMYFTLKNPTNRNIFLVIFGLTTLYFAGSMVRLLVLLAPAFALLVSVGVMGTIKPFYTLLRESGSQAAMKSKRGLRRINKEYSAIAIVIVFLLLMSTFAFTPQTGGQPRVYSSVYNPITISAASLPITPAEPIPQWRNMLSYTRNNLQSTDVVASWWDYGDWLGMFGNVTTLCDNTTGNSTQIENVGYALMAPENQSVRMLRTYDSKFVLVFLTLRLTLSTDQTQITGVSFAGYGDEGKWSWMARISGNAQTRFKAERFMDDSLYWSNETSFGSVNNSTQQFVWSDMGLNSTIYKIMRDAEQAYANAYGISVSDQEAPALTYFTQEYIAGLEITPSQAAQQYGLLIPLVCLYKIDYNAYNAANPNATLTLPP
jgi:dolichyl-diphosphooligosaccharide---protein glycosyltransferase